MATVIVLQDRQVFRGRWSNLRRCTDHRFALVLSPAALPKLKDEQKRCFEEVAILEDYSAKGIGHFLRSGLKLAPPSFIVTNDEYCLRVAAKLRQQFGLPGHTPEEVAPFTDKVLMKRQAAAAGIPVPKFMAYDPRAFEAGAENYLSLVLEELGLPVVAKPVNEANSRNVFLLSGVRELKQWCGANRGCFGLELEQYVRGKVVFCDAALQGRVAHPLMACEYANPPLDFDRGAVHGSIVLPDGPERDALYRFNERVLAALGPINDCVTHLEAFRRPSGQLVLLEVAARAPGAFVSAIGEIYAGINFEELNFLLQMEEKPVLGPPTGEYGAWAWFPKRHGTVARCNQAAVASPHRVVWNVRPGDRLADIPPGQPHSTDDAVCTVLLWNANVEVLRRDFELLKTFTPVCLEDHAKA